MGLVTEHATVAADGVDGLGGRNFIFKALKKPKYWLFLYFTLSPSPK